MRTGQALRATRRETAGAIPKPCLTVCRPLSARRGAGRIRADVATAIADARRGAATRIATTCASSAGLLCALLLSGRARDEGEGEGVVPRRVPGEKAWTHSQTTCARQEADAITNHTSLLRTVPLAGYRVGDKCSCFCENREMMPVTTALLPLGRARPPALRDSGSCARQASLPRHQGMANRRKHGRVEAVRVVSDAHAVDHGHPNALKAAQQAQMVDFFRQVRLPSSTSVYKEGLWRHPGLTRRPHTPSRPRLTSRGTGAAPSSWSFPASCPGTSAKCSP